MNHINVLKRLRALTLITGLAGALAILSSGTAQAVPPSATTLEIRVNHFEVLATNENRDEVRIKFQPDTSASWRTLWTGSNLDRGDIRDLLGRSELFRAAATPRVQFIELDCGCILDPDDHIATAAVSKTPGSHVLTVSGDGARYRLYYQVVAA